MSAAEQGAAAAALNREYQQRLEAIRAAERAANEAERQREAAQNSGAQQ